MSTENYFVPVESYSPSGELIVSFLIPDRRYVISSISDTLPDGVSLSDFPEYEDGDLIRVIVVNDTNSSIPGDAELVQPMKLFESSTGNYLDVMVYSNEDRKFNVSRGTKKIK